MALHRYKSLPPGLKQNRRVQIMGNESARVAFIRASEYVHTLRLLPGEKQVARLQLHDKIAAICLAYSTLTRQERGVELADFYWLPKSKYAEFAVMFPGVRLPASSSAMLETCVLNGEFSKTEAVMVHALPSDTHYACVAKFGRVRSSQTDVAEVKCENYASDDEMGAVEPPPKRLRIDANSGEMQQEGVSLCSNPQERSQASSVGCSVPSADRAWRAIQGTSLESVEDIDAIVALNASIGRTLRRMDSGDDADFASAARTLQRMVDYIGQIESKAEDAVLRAATLEDLLGQYEVCRQQQCEAAAAPWVRLQAKRALQDLILAKLKANKLRANTLEMRLGNCDLRKLGAIELATLDLTATYAICAATKEDQETIWCNTVGEHLRLSLRKAQGKQIPQVVLKVSAAFQSIAKSDACICVAGLRDLFASLAVWADLQANGVESKHATRAAEFAEEWRNRAADVRMGPLYKSLMTKNVDAVIRSTKSKRELSAVVNEVAASLAGYGDAMLQEAVFDDDMMEDYMGLLVMAADAAAAQTERAIVDRIVDSVRQSVVNFADALPPAQGWDLCRYPTLLGDLDALVAAEKQAEEGGWKRELYQLRVKVMRRAAEPLQKEQSRAVGGKLQTAARKLGEMAHAIAAEDGSALPSDGDLAEFVEAATACRLANAPAVAEAVSFARDLARTSRDTTDAVVDWARVARVTAYPEKVYNWDVSREMQPLMSKLGHGLAAAVQRLALQVKGARFTDIEDLVARDRAQSISMVGHPEDALAIAKGVGVEPFAAQREKKMQILSKLVPMLAGGAFAGEEAEALRGWHTEVLVGSLEDELLGAAIAVEQDGRGELDLGELVRRAMKRAPKDRDPVDLSALVAHVCKMAEKATS